jgi:hypothetical protein
MGCCLRRPTLRGNTGLFGSEDGSVEVRYGSLRVFCGYKARAVLDCGVGVLSSRHRWNHSDVGCSCTVQAR